MYTHQNKFQVGVNLLGNKKLLILVLILILILLILILILTFPPPERLPSVDLGPCCMSVNNEWRQCVWMLFWRVDTSDLLLFPPRRSNPPEGAWVRSTRISSRQRCEVSDGLTISNASVRRFVRGHHPTPRDACRPPRPHSLLFYICFLSLAHFLSSFLQLFSSFSSFLESSASPSFPPVTINAPLWGFLLIYCCF